MTSCFQNQSTSSQKFQAHPPRRPEEADDVGRIIQFQMSLHERLFEKLMTHPKVDEAHSNAPLFSRDLNTVRIAVRTRAMQNAIIPTRLSNVKTGQMDVVKDAARWSARGRYKKAPENCISVYGGGGGGEEG